MSDTIEKYSGDGIKFSHAITEAPNDSNYKLHIHDDYEILCVASGNVGYTVEGSAYDLPPGCVVIMKSAEMHKLVVHGEEKYERYIINFKPEVLYRYGFDRSILDAFLLRSVGDKNLYLPEDFNGIEPLGIFRQISAGLTRVSGEMLIVSNLSALLCAINTVFYRGNDIRKNDSDSYEKSVISYINEHLLEDKSLSMLSEEMHVSVSQLNRIFHKMTGTSVYNYMLTKRLVYAQGMIYRGESATNACQSCGFRDYSSFFRLYKKHFGKAPTADKVKG